MKKLIALVGAVGLTASLGVAAATTATAAPKSSPANCVGKVISMHTRSGLAAGPELVLAAKAFCRDGIPFHPPV